MTSTSEREFNVGRIVEDVDELFDRFNKEALADDGLYSYEIEKCSLKDGK